MKILVYAVILGVIAGGAAMWVNQLATSDPGKPIRSGCGPSTEAGEVPFCINLIMGIINTEGPDLDMDGQLLWDDWIQNHFQVVDANNAAVPLTRKMRVPMLTSRQNDTYPNEGFLVGTLKQGQQYTLTYTPIKSEGKHYSVHFTADVEQFPYKSRFLEPKE